MKIFLRYLAIALFVPAFANFVNAQCDEGQSELTFQVVTDGWPQETSWAVVNYNTGEELISGEEDADESLCVNTDECLVFIIEDTWGDGITDPGGYYVQLDGDTIGQGGDDFDYSAYVQMGCDPGMTCNDPVSIGTGSFSTGYDDQWYSFSVQETGMYQITTCGLNDCDTRIGVYDQCNLLEIDDSNEGTLYHDDDEGGCGNQAQLNLPAEAGDVFLVRIYTDPEGDCAGSIDFEINYNGPITGCMDQAACNYNPLATESDGSCIYPGNPDCPAGPDLIVLQEAIASSLVVDETTVGSNNCYINEGCLNGYGTRELIRFTTHIKNIGETDYYIGNPTDNPEQFTYDNCHNHNHYEGYAEYLLYNGDGDLLPIGFKNGFCVMDLECEDGGSSQYGCSDMGISKDCGDIYSSGLSCQWIDVTNVEDGNYTLVVRVNWDQDADALGRQEMDYSNNWAQVCINIDRSSGELEVTQIDECPDYEDCNGVPFGTAEEDCEGECGGDHMTGDLDENQQYQMADALGYTQGILTGNLDAWSCTDLNSDEDISVTDAALMSLCNIYTVMEETNPNLYHTNCDFPKPDVINPFDTMKVKMGTLNTDENYFDILVSNKWKRLVGYQLQISGVSIGVLEDLTPADYPIQPEHNGNGMIYGLSYQDSSLYKSTDYQPLVRVHYNEITGGEICVDEIIDMVNSDYENPIMELEDACFDVSSIESLDNPYLVNVAPNPFNNTTTLSLGNWSKGKVSLQLLDVSGRVVRDYGVLTNNRVEIHRDELNDGIYFYRLTGDYKQTGRIVVMD